MAAMPSPGLIEPLQWTRTRVFAAAASAIYVGCAAFLVYDLLGRPAAGMDDANIFFVYARNFVHGHGIVYSVGGGHVEGFTSVLYFLLCSACYAVTGTPETLLLVLNAVFAIASTALVLRALTTIGEAAGHTRWGPAILIAAYLGWVCCNPAYFAWNVVSLMDCGLYGLMIVWSYALLVGLALGRPVWRERLQMSAVAGGLVLVRPEGIVWAMVLLVAHAALRSERGLGAAAVARKVWPGWAAFAATALGLVTFRLVYFGWPLPNTYYAKVSASAGATLTDGWHYFAGFVDLYGAAAVLPMAAMVLLAVMSLRGGLARMGAVQRAALLTVAFAAMGLALPIVEGGDHFYGARMFQPVYPLLGACLLLPTAWLREPGVSIKMAMYVAVCGAAIATGDPVTWSRFAASNNATAAVEDIRLDVLGEFSIAVQERLNGERLSAIFAPELPTVGFGSAGGIAYGYQGQVYDMMGLNDTRMAHADAVKSGPKGHQSFNKDVFYAVAPDVLMPRAAGVAEPVSLASVSGSYTNPAGWDNLIFKGLYNDAAFQSRYVLALVWNSAHPEYKCYGYFNRTYLQRKLEQGTLKMLDIADAMRL
jgi:hypothetical protein